jgi:hypothetical protein
MPNLSLFSGDATLKLPNPVIVDASLGSRYALDQLVELLLLSF